MTPEGVTGALQERDGREGGKRSSTRLRERDDGDDVDDDDGDDKGEKRQEQIK